MPRSNNPAEFHSKHSVCSVLLLRMKPASATSPASRMPFPRRSNDVICGAHPSQPRCACNTHRSGTHVHTRWLRESTFTNATHPSSPKQHSEKDTLASRAAEINRSRMLASRRADEGGGGGSVVISPPSSALDTGTNWLSTLAASTASACPSSADTGVDERRTSPPTAGAPAPAPAPSGTGLAVTDIMQATTGLETSSRPLASSQPSLRLQACDTNFERGQTVDIDSIGLKKINCSGEIVLLM